VGAIATSARAAAAAPSLPLGEGREIVAVACTQCHPTAQLREGRNAWRFQLYDMILRGAQIMPSEIEPVVNYLATNFGPGINVPPPLTQVTLPGPGKDLVESHCAVCHGLDRVAGAKLACRVVFLGAPVSADETKTITTYLDDKFSSK
jgi:mono/diheme cytochrome c family protein